MNGMLRRVPKVINVIHGDGVRFRDSQSAKREIVARPGANPYPVRPENCPSHLAGGNRWYVVYSQPHREFRAQMQLAAQGYRTFLPRYRKTVRHARKLMTVNAPFFSRYLFVGLDLNRDQWRSINGTFGVTSLMSDGTFPIPVPLGVIESLITISDADGFVNLGDALQIGERVRVLTGPFADLIGELVRLDGARRVRVLLQLLGGVVAVSVDRDRLVPVRAA
jgi:transcription elongation factor/antiterminator RfaH